MDDKDMDDRKDGPPASRATIRDVAVAAGVSMGTVSRVAAGNPRISDATRQRVLAAMKKLAYQPNIAARAMRTNVSRTVGLLIPDMTCPIFSRVAAGAEPVLSAAGYMLLTFSSNRSTEREMDFFHAARQRQMDGLIVSVCDEGSADTLGTLRDLTAPVVVLDRDLPVETDAVFNEHYGAMRTAVEHLLALGHRRIGLICATEKIRPGRERCRAYRDALTEAGVPVDPRLIRATGQGHDYGYAEGQTLLLGPDAPTALISAGSDTFCGTLRAIRNLGLSIPRDLSLIGADDIEVGPIAGPSITMVERDMFEAGRLAARYLLDRMRGEDAPPRRLILDSRVVMRQSVAAPRGAAAPAGGPANAQAVSG